MLIFLVIYYLKIQRILKQIFKISILPNVPPVENITTTNSLMKNVKRGKNKKKGKGIIVLLS